MQKVKGVLWVIIIGIFGLVVFQNQDFFLAPQSLGIDFYFFAYQTTELPTAVLFAAFFFIGWLLAYLFCLADRYRSNRTIRELRQTISGHKSAVDALKNDIDTFKKDTPSSDHRMEETVAPAKEMPDPPSVKQD